MKKLLAAALLSLPLMSQAQTVVPLYDKAVPNARPCNTKEVQQERGRISGVTVPTLTVYLPAKPDSAQAAVIICPGGGYVRLATEHEGHEVAKAFNEAGVAAFVLKYRLPDDACMTNKELVPLQDAQQAIKLVRDNSRKWNINPSRVGVLGFSAGGHVASSVGTKFGQAVIPNAANTNLRPDFLILGYPVISFSDNLAHPGSREHLIGKTPAADRVVAYSNDRQVTAQTPPTFLMHAADDKSVPVGNTLAFFQALQHHQVPAEMHIYQRGGHGFGLHNPTSPDKWFERALNWMRSNRLIADKPAAVADAPAPKTKKAR
ncbi:alpha/beta hydrolase [Solirubrum puertoriconensis]|uniref:BD-FAE-like domain-containing protein n=1 Tax=Solirubrum puertoriconensis TaxID=1751427 RepID=A0A9X0L683_SOLP1|nr:alpha/beta hydrolase [Solirubrum puertoriconensis]KUG09502.1 hypothetical protein ASU33_17445 [Solirubrum puertoriconensis]